MVLPRTQVSGLELTSTKTVGTQMMRTSRSATLRLTRNTLVEFLISLLNHTTIGTKRFPTVPMTRISKHITETQTLKVSEKFKETSLAKHSEVWLKSFSDMLEHIEEAFMAISDHWNVKCGDFFMVTRACYQHYSFSSHPLLITNAQVNDYWWGCKIPVWDRGMFNHARALMVRR